MPGIRLINLGQTDSSWTQAVYHAVAESMKDSSPDTIILCRPSAPYLCLGYHQRFDEVFDLEECKRLALPVLRRKIGGGATLLDANQLFYQCVFHRSRVPVHNNDLYQMMLSAPVAALQKMGLPAELYDGNEIRVGSKRIAGTGGGLIGEATVVVGNILMDFDYATMVRVWRPRGGSEFRAMADRALRGHLTTLQQEQKAIPFDDLEQLLVAEYARFLGRPLTPGSLTDDESRRSIELAAELSSTEFLNLHIDNVQGRSFPPLKIAADSFIHEGTAYIAGTPVHGMFLVQGGVIVDVHLEFDSQLPLKIMAQRLPGVAFERWIDVLQEGVEVA